MSKTISILGLGLIGGSLAKAIKSFIPEITILGYDKKEVLQSALKDGSIDKELSGIKESKDSDIIFLSLPTELSLDALSKLAPILKDNSIITDVAGVKLVFENRWKSLTSKGVYIGGHPMTGKEKGGYENSDHLLFENAVYILTENNITNNENYDYLLDLIKQIGGRIKFLSAELHDEIVAKVSHIPQLLSTALVNHASKENGNNAWKNSAINYLDFAAGGFRDMTRIASSDFEVWKSVLQNNKDYILKSLLNFVAELTDMSNNILRDDYKALQKNFESARKKRDEIPKNSKGFIHNLFDVFVYVKDEAGVLSKISTILYENSINIKDVEILKIREGTGGTMRISFESKQIADKAASLIKSIGFKVTN